MLGMQGMMLKADTRAPAAASRQAESRAAALSAAEKIDICRGLFAYLVVVAHAMELAWVVHPDVAPRMSPATLDLWKRTVGTGGYWVMGFFVLSGYCIQLSVGRLRAAGRFPLRYYLAARLSRILPLYYLALLFVVWTERLIAWDRPGYWPNGINGSVLIAQFLGLQGLTQTYGSFAPSWSITNELFYYLIYGLLVCLPLGKPDRPAWLGVALCVAVAGAMQAVYALGLRTPWVLAVGLLFGLGLNWFLGALVALHLEALRGSRAIRMLARAWPLGLVLAACLRFDEHIQGLVLPCGLAFGLLLVRFGPCEEAGPATATWRSSLARLLGLSSYPTYLFHGPVLMLAAAILMRWDLARDWRVTWGMLAASGIIAGLVLGVVAEAPLMTWRAYWLRRWKSGLRPSPVLVTPHR
ncbi:MAG: acyltransferase [Isosphaeraceae bacterium]|nr:acyltransferase [Isosphaeraceae bacterium]